MKKIYALGMTAALVLVATSVFAIGFSAPKVTNIVKDVGKMAVVNDLNKFLSQQKCQCNKKTGEITSCNLDEIGKRVNRDKSALKIALGRHINFYYNAPTYDCSRHIESKIKSRYGSYWNWKPWRKTSGVQLSVD